MTPWLWGVGLAGLAAMAAATRRWGIGGALAVYGGVVVIAGCAWPFVVIAGHLAGADPGRMAQLRVMAPEAAVRFGGGWAVAALPALGICAAWAIRRRTS